MIAIEITTQGMRDEVWDMEEVQNKDIRGTEYRFIQHFVKCKKTKKKTDNVKVLKVSMQKGNRFEHISHR